MSDLVAKVHDSLATMNDEQRVAYSIGLSHAFEEVFEVIAWAFKGSGDLGAVRRQLTANWESVRAVQVVRGVL